ncbi:MAG: TRAP transporter large permease [Desulfotomaculales bacterium]
MNPATAAFAGVGILVLFLLLRMPVGFAMLLSGFLGFVFLASPEAAFNVLSGDLWEQFSSYGLSVVPLFVFMGSIAFHSGVTENLYRAAHRWTGHLRGGLAATTVLASMGFAAICGSNAATAATMGTIALPQMQKYRYDPALSAGSVACGGTLGVVIPPSVVLIVIAIQTGQSVGQLFVASVVPGVLLGLLFLFTVFLLCARNPELGPAGEKASLPERLAALPGVIETLILFFLVVGGLYRGWFTPTEAGAAGSCGALLLALVQRKINREKFTRAVLETVRISAMVIMLVAGGVVFGRFLTLAGLPLLLTDWVAALAAPPLAVLGIIVLVYVLGGMFMDALAFLVVTIPVFFPLALQMGYDPLWLSVFLNVLTTMGAVTPPVGVCAYIVSGIDPAIPLSLTFKGVLYFLPAFLVLLLILLFCPWIVTSLVG